MITVTWSPHPSIWICHAWDRVRIGVPEGPRDILLWKEHWTRSWRLVCTASSLQSRWLPPPLPEACVLICIMGVERVEQTLRVPGRPSGTTVPTGMGGTVGAAV